MYVAGKCSLRHIFFTNLVIKDCLNPIAIITNLHKSMLCLTLSALLPVINYLIPILSLQRLYNAKKRA